jgi:hypothetical protein
MSEETNVENIAPEPIKEAPKSKKKRVPKRKRAHAANPKKRKVS